MSRDGPISDYLTELQSALNVPAGSRVLRETEDHLRESVERLRRLGMSYDEAEHRAVQSFGRPDHVAQLMRDTIILDTEATAMLKLLIKCVISGMAVLTGLFALLVLTFLAVSPHGGALNIAAQIIAATFVASMAALTLYELWRNTAARSVLFGGALMLLALGSAWVVWSIHIGLVTGDWEYHFLTAAMLVTVQGALTAALSWHSASSGGNPALTT